LPWRDTLEDTHGSLRPSPAYPPAVNRMSL